MPNDIWRRCRALRSHDPHIDLCGLRDDDDSRIASVECGPINNQGALAGVFGSDTVTVATTGTFADKNAAVGKTVDTSSALSGADSGNYTLTNADGTVTATIDKATLSVTGITANNKTYDGTDAATLSNQGALAGVILSLKHN